MPCICLLACLPACRACRACRVCCDLDEPTHDNGLPPPLDLTTSCCLEHPSVCDCPFTDRAPHASGRPALSQTLTMPFLRRRGVMASESDMRRHTTLLEPKPQAELFLSPESASHRLESGATPPDSDSRRLSADPNAETDRASQDSYDRPESPPIQDETPRHRRFSMLRFRNASDSQLSTRWRQQQQASEKPPPMPERTVPPASCLSCLSCLLSPARPIPHTSHLLPPCPRGPLMLTCEPGFSSCHYHNSTHDQPLGK